MRKIALILLLLFYLFPFTPASAQDDSLIIYYAGPEGGVRSALGLIPSVAFTTDPKQAQVLVLNGVIPDAEEMAQQVEAGSGLLLILGPGITEQQLRAFVPTPFQLERREEPVSLVGSVSSEDPTVKNIVWNSAPQVRERHNLVGENISFEPIVTSFEDEEMILGFGQIGKGKVFLFTPSLDQTNPQFQGWAYFNYLIYQLTARAAGETPLSFGDYPASPVPHARDRLILFGLLGGTLVLAILIFGFVRRYSFAHPEALDALVARHEKNAPKPMKKEWDEVGFHRPLGGFLVALMLGLVMFIPLIIYQNLILPVYILPSAQALGIWGRVVQFFQFMWLLFDVGTSAAFIKYFAEYRVHDPRKAIQFGQLFVWWQALSGAIQVAVVTAIASTVLPQTVYALYAWSIIIHTLIQIPGFFMVIRHSLMGWQRFDFAQVLDIGWQVLFPMITQPVLILLVLAFARNNPVFGIAMGGLFGLGFAAYASEALTFLLGLWLYRRAGYNARVLFMAHFDWKLLFQAFRFGIFEMLGSVAWATGQATEILITQARLVNYTEVWGNWILAQNFIFAFQVLSTLFSNVMPAISESISNARTVLSQYYEVMSYKWGGIISAFIGAVLLAVADRFILGASGPEFVRAAAYATPLIIWGAIQYPSWVGDSVQLASNRPYLKAAMVFGEQVIRIVLAFILLERFQINALIIAYFVGLLTKDIAAYFVNHRLCFPQRFYFWQSLAAPFLAGAVHYVILRWLTGMIWQGDQITSIIIFFIGILPSYPVFAFFYGFFGGWDDDTLKELRKAVDLTGFVRPMAWLFWAASWLGSSISPLHGRFPIDIQSGADLEAGTLTQERVSLV